MLIWPLHDIAFTNIVWHVLKQRMVGGGNTVLRNRVGDEEGKWSAQTMGVFANNSIDSCTKASN